MAEDNQIYECYSLIKKDSNLDSLRVAKTTLVNVSLARIPMNLI